ncbi:hypothetical protein NDU88_002123, partial [Pleurodeles waltl]
RNTIILINARSPPGPPLLQGNSIELSDQASFSVGRQSHARVIVPGPSRCISWQECTNAP